MLHEGCNTYNMTVTVFVFAFFLFGFPHSWNCSEIRFSHMVSSILFLLIFLLYFITSQTEVILPYQWTVKMFCLVVKTFMCRPDSNLHAMHIQFWSIPLSLIIIFIACSRGRAITLHGFKTLINITSWSAVR